MPFGGGHEKTKAVTEGKEGKLGRGGDGGGVGVQTGWEERKRSRRDGGKMKEIL